MYFHEAVTLFTKTWAQAFKAERPVQTPYLVLGPPGIGKCLGKGTPVLMASGHMKNVEDVQVGDRVMGPDGTPRTVQETHSGTSQLFRVIPQKGDPWVCNENHVLTLVSTDTGQAKDVPLCDYLEPGRDYFRSRHKQFHVGIDAFEESKAMADLPVDPYFLGVWFGDGTKEIRGGQLAKINITAPDSEIADVCRKTARSWGLTAKNYAKPMDLQEPCPVWALTGTHRGQGNNPLLDVMRDLLGPELVIPSVYKTADREARLAFLAGFLDTDGNIPKGTNTFEITQKRRDYAEAIRFIARSLGFQASLKKKAVKAYPDTSYWRVFISGDTHLIPTRIPRKKAQVRQQLKDATRTGIRIEPLGDGEYFGFGVDGDHRFLLGDFTVTHNSSAPEEAARVIRHELKVAGDTKPFHFLKLDLSSQLPEDLGGIPKTVKDDQLRMTVTSFAVQRRLAPFCQPGARGILVLDDITQAAPSVQVAARQTVLDRALGDYHLARDVMIIITGNRREDKSSARELPAHFRNSCCMINIEPHLDNWRDWYGTQKDCNPIIGSFLRLRPNHFSELPTDSDARGVFATPRTWHKLGQLFDVAVDSHQLMAVSRGLIGEGHGPELVAFWRLRKEMSIDPVQLLKNPKGTIPDPRQQLNSPDKVNAIITSVSEAAAMLSVDEPQRSQELALQFIKAVTWSTGGGQREYLAVALNVFLSNGGNRKDLGDAIRYDRDDPLVHDFYEFLRSVRDLRKSLEHR